jgi:hypothetical protein
MSQEDSHPSDSDVERLFDLISIPNNILKEHYGLSRFNETLQEDHGARMHYSMEVAHKPNAVSWRAKFDDVLEPLAILILKPPDARLDAVKCDVDGVPDHDVPCLRELIKEAQDMKEIHGCSRIAFYAGKNLITCRSVTEPNERKTKAHPDFAVSMIRGVTRRYHLLTWLGNAIRQKRIKMLSPLPGCTLEESTVDALPLSLPPPRFYSDELLTTNRIVHKVPIDTGDDICYAYMVHNGTSHVPIRLVPSPLPAFPNDDLDTPEKVAAASENILTKFLRQCGEAHMENALTWFVRHPQIRTNKELVAILQLAAVGTIIPGDWGIVKSDLTFTNGEGIVRTAIPVYEEISRLGQERECYCLALFDYRNLILVTRKKGNKVEPSVALVTGDGIRGALLQ